VDALDEEVMKRSSRHLDGHALLGAIRGDMGHQPGPLVWAEIVGAEHFVERRAIDGRPVAMELQPEPVAVCVVTGRGKDVIGLLGQPLDIERVIVQLSP
jgi:hypothetical protein